MTPDNSREHATDFSPEDDNFDAEETQAGPFSVGPVDPLVYSKDHDLPPELRPAAAQISARVAQEVPTRQERPRPQPQPQEAPHTVWTPADTEPEDPWSEPSKPRIRIPIGRILLNMALAIPLVMIAVVIWYAATHLTP